MTSTLVLLRHGQSLWNLENRFTGWTDVDLSEEGVAEAVEAGRLMRESGLTFDIVHTSLLLRATRTAEAALAEMRLHWLPVERNWRLNERHYGALQGLNKKETAERHGSEQVHEWRRSYDTPPPPLALDDERHPRFDPKYATLAPEQIPGTECLKDVVDRMLPYWYDFVVPRLRRGVRQVIVAHGNSLRALVKHLDRISDDEISDLNIPTGRPLIYVLDEDLEPVEPSRYLGDQAEIAAAAQAVAGQAG